MSFRGRVGLKREAVHVARHDLPVDDGQRAYATVFVGNEIDHKRAGGNSDRFAAPGRVDERLRQLAPSGIAEGMNDAREAVAAFAGESQVVGVALLAIEVSAPGEQFEHALRAFGDSDLDGPLIA